ncbi:MAG: AbrB/MazE/SpoVT family DNA-binding domain-containing protein [Dehalococcoidia bacterium]
MPRSKGRKKRPGRIAEAPAVYAAPALTKVTRHGQITLPSEVRRAMGIEEGDLIEVQIAGDNVMLTPKRLIDKSQAYFWTPEWQAAETEAEADIKAGRVKGFASADELFEDLDE